LRKKLTFQTKSFEVAPRFPGIGDREKIFWKKIFKKKLFFEKSFFFLFEKK